MKSQVRQHTFDRRMMRITSRVGVGTAVAMLCSLPFSLPAAASAPELATGGFTFTSDTQTPTSFPGTNVVIFEVSTLAYTGDLSGSAADTDTFVAHADGSFEGHGTEVCNPCTLWGHSGSFTAEFTFKGVGDNYVGQETIVASSGGLAGLHGTGTFEGLVAENINTYAYKIQLG